MARTVTAPPTISIYTLAATLIVFFALMMGFAYLVQVVSIQPSPNPLDRAMGVTDPVWQLNFSYDTMAFDPETREVHIVGRFAGRLVHLPESEEEWNERADAVAREYSRALRGTANRVRVDFYHDGRLMATGVRLVQ